MEAPDNAGKTTTMNKVYDILQKLNIHVEQTEQPSKTLFDGKIRDILLNANTSKQTQLHLFMADRYKFYEENKDIINSDKDILLCDRCLLSSLSYQSGNSQHRDKSMIDIIHQHKELLDLNTPERLFYLDVDIEEIERRMSGQEVNKLDSTDKSDIIKQKYNYSQASQILNTQWDIDVINANQSINLVVFDILRAVLLDLNKTAMANLSCNTKLFTEKVKHMVKNINKYKGEVYKSIEFNIYTGHVIILDKNNKIYYDNVEDYQYDLENLMKFETIITDLIYEIIKRGDKYA